jgi:hypothetical protein
MLRREAITLLHEIATTCSELLDNVTQVSLQMSEGDTKLILKSRLDFAQKTALLDVLSNKGLKVIDCSSDCGTVLVMY